MNNKKLIVFDLDQTLVYTLPRFHRVFCEILGKNISWDEFLKSYAEDSLNRYICEAGIEVEKFWKEFLKKYYPPHPADKLIDGVDNILRILKSRGYIIVIHTGRIVPREYVWKELKDFGIVEFIDDVYTEDERFRTASFDKSVKLIEIRDRFKPDVFIYVGDYWPDMVSGKKAGAFVVGVTTGLEKEEKLRKFGADVVIESVSDICSVIP